MVDSVRIDGVSRVDEDDCVPRIQLLPDGAVLRMSEVLVLDAVAGEKGHAVGVEDVEGVFDFGERALRVEEVGHGGEEAVLGWVLVAQGGGVLVCLSG